MLFFCIPSNRTSLLHPTIMASIIAWNIQFTKFVIQTTDQPNNHNNQSSNLQICENVFLFTTSTPLLYINFSLQAFCVALCFAISLQVFCMRNKAHSLEFEVNFCYFIEYWWINYFGFTWNKKFYEWFRECSGIDHWQNRIRNERRSKLRWFGRMQWMGESHLPMRMAPGRRRMIYWLG